MDDELKMNDSEIIEVLDFKFGSEYAIKWNQFVLIRKKQNRIEDPIPSQVIEWLEKGIYRLANMIGKLYPDCDDPRIRAEHELVDHARKAGFQV